MAKLHLTSLGCPKNRVDAEHMLGIALKNGHELVNDAEKADTLVVNTCAFINDAKEESIEAILQMAKLKESFPEKKLIVTGCLAQRYASDLEKEIPEVDHFLGTSDYSLIDDLLENKSNNNNLVLLGYKNKKKNLVSSDLSYIEKFDLPRVNTSISSSAYLRISEGCDNKCAFCIIPKLRGKQRSRSIEDLVNEASLLAKQGVFELNLIGQDLTAYGFDLKDRPSLKDLLLGLSGVEGIKWIRQLYAYPRTFDEDYFKIFENKNILPYIDMPTQHGSSKILRAMRRGGSKERLNKIIASLKNNIENLVLRTTVIVGFPGETEDDFKELCDFAIENQFDRLGVFKYSNEENTEAFNYKEQISEEIKEERYNKLMLIQQKISEKKLKKLKGQVFDAIVEGPSEEHDLLLKGRIWSQAPEIDGITYISSEKSLKIGDLVKIKITDTHSYDVVGEII